MIIMIVSIMQSFRTDIVQSYIVLVVYGNLLISITMPITLHMFWKTWANKELWLSLVP